MAHPHPLSPRPSSYFPDKDAAVAYAEKYGIDAHVIATPPKKLKIQAYADNFR